MKYEVHWARHENELAHVMTDKFEIRIASYVRDIVRGSGYGIINRDYSIVGKNFGNLPRHLFDVSKIDAAV